jgi:hypothetical protein
LKTQEIGVALPSQLHRGAGYTKLWHNFGKALTLTGILLTVDQIASGDPLLLNDFTKPKEMEFLQDATSFGLSQNDYSSVIKFAAANNSRTNTQLPSPGVVGIYYASSLEVMNRQFPDMSKVQPGSFITGGWGSFYSDAQSASGALNKKVSFAIIYYRANGNSNFYPVKMLQIAPSNLNPQPKSTLENKKD